MYIHFFAVAAIVFFLLASVLWLRSFGVEGRVKGLALSFFGLGLVCNLVFVGLVFWRNPSYLLGTAGGVFSASSVVVSLVMVYLLRRPLTKSFGVVMVPICLFYAVVAGVVSHQPFLEESGSERGFLFVLHLVLFVLANIAFGLSFSSSIIRLAKSSLLKGRLKSLPWGKIPSIVWLDKVSIESLHVGLVFFGLGIVLGLVDANLRGASIGMSKVLLSGLVGVCYLALSVAWNARYLRGQKFALVSLVGFVLLSANNVVVAVW